MALVLTAFVAAVPKIDQASVANLPDELGNLIEWIRPRVAPSIFLLSAITGFARVGRAWLESKWIWSVGQSVLDFLCKNSFEGLEGDAHHHRVTLFEFRPLLLWIWPWRAWYWPWGWGRGPTSGWLVPILRSGHTTKKSRTVFLAPDDADRAEGVAGKTWATRNREIVVEGLADPELGKPKTVVDYAKRTGVTTEWLTRQIEQGRQMALSFRAIPIEVSGRRWGVLLLDSRDPGGVAKNREKVDIAPYASLLGKLLERTS